MLLKTFGRDNWKILNIYYILDNNIVSMLNFLILIIVLWLCKRIHLSRQIHTEAFKKKVGEVCNLLSNSPSNIYVCVYVNSYMYTVYIYMERERNQINVTKY